MTHFFGARNEHSEFDQYFALADDGRAVQFSYDRPIWLPITPSKKLGVRVLNDRTLKRLSDTEVKYLFDLIDPPRNFSVKWRAEQRWAGSDFASLYVFSVAAIWFFEEQILGWPRGYTVMLLVVASFLPIVLLMWDFKPLERALVRLSVRIKGKRVRSLVDLPPQAASEPLMAGPAQPALSEIIRKMPEKRFQELARMGAKLAQQDAEWNLRVRAKLHQTTDAAKQMVAQKYITTSHGITQKQSAKPQVSTPSEKVNTIFREADERDVVPTKVGMSIMAEVLKKRAQALAARMMASDAKDRTQETARILAGINERKKQPKVSNHSKQVNTILREADQTDVVPTKAGISIHSREVEADIQVTDL